MNIRNTIGVSLAGAVAVLGVGAAMALAHPGSAAPPQSPPAAPALDVPEPGDTPAVPGVVDVPEPGDVPDLPGQ